MVAWLPEESIQIDESEFSSGSFLLPKIGGAYAFEGKYLNILTLYRKII